MSKNSAIEIFLRVRPTKTTFEGFRSAYEMEWLEEREDMYWILRNVSGQTGNEDGQVNNKEQKRNFAFNRVLGPQTKQQKVFDLVAKDVVDSAIEGFNGTIFAYGQTGSGKTFTMTGGSESYEDRGLIPRTLSYIFNKRKDHMALTQVWISYLQVYQSVGYDLLSKENLTRKLTDLDKIVPYENADGQIILDGLGQEMVQNEERALEWLFLGDTNRIVSKTPKNDQSTRSHCIFIVKIVTMKPGSDIKTVAMLHLVDLSGSERIKDTGVDGLLQREAISINLELHHLQRVIVCLNKKARGQSIHVPYRQSLMTLILRDSIGGNCKTRMVATMSPKPQDIAESVCTCRFAMRVALIKNDLLRNQTVDPAIIIARLKKENAQLKAQLAILKGGQVQDELSKYDIEDCHRAVDEYLAADDLSGGIVMTDRLRLNECFFYLKNMMKKGGGSSAAVANQSIVKAMVNNSQVSHSSSTNAVSIPGPPSPTSTDQLKKLRLMIQQKDNEIAILLALINRKKEQNKQMTIPVQRAEEQELLKSVVKGGSKEIVFEERSLYFKPGVEGQPPINGTQSNPGNSNLPLQAPQASLLSTGSHPQKQSALTGLDNQQLQKMLTRPINLSPEQLLDHELAFQHFRKAWRKAETLEKNKSIMEEMMAEGRQWGKAVNGLREKIMSLKGKLEQVQRDKAVNSLVNGSQPSQQEQEEETILQEITRLKEEYRNSSQKLKTLKNKIDNIQALEKQNYKQLNEDFQKWILVMQRERTTLVGGIPNSANNQSSVLASTQHTANSIPKVTLGSELSINMSKPGSNQSTTMMGSSIRDESVNQKLDAFYKAREEIRKK